MCYCNCPYEYYPSGECRGARFQGLQDAFCGEKYNPEADEESFEDITRDDDYDIGLPRITYWREDF